MAELDQKFADLRQDIALPLQLPSDSQNANCLAMPRKTSTSLEEQQRKCVMYQNVVSKLAAVRVHFSTVTKTVNSPDMTL